MKHIVTLCTAFLLSAAPVLAQDSVAENQGSWTTVSTPALKLSESMFNNWSKSGTSQIDLNITFFGNYKYTHPKYVWDNIVDLGFGHAWQDLDNSSEGGRFESRRKSLDKIDLTSALSWKAYKDWGASFTANLKTQFANGYEYAAAGDNDGKLVSSFFAPAYLTTALSFEYKKTDWSISLSFLTGKTTFVFNDDLIDSGYTYGVIQENGFDPTDPNRIHTHAYFALGSYLKAQYLKKDILPSLDLYARLELFYDYKKPSTMAWGKIQEYVDGGEVAGTLSEDIKYTPVESEETWQDLAQKNWLQRRIFETDLDFELKLDYRLSSHIAANFALNLKWDTDFNGMGKWGHLQVYQMAGLQVFFSWKTPK